MQGIVKSSDSVTKLEPAAMTRLTTSFSEHVSVVVEVCQTRLFNVSDVPDATSPTTLQTVQTYRSIVYACRQ